MKKERLIALSMAVLLVVTLLVAGCMPGNVAPREVQNGENVSEQYPLTVTDDLGREVTLSAKPERIVSLLPSLTEILFALEEGGRVVGVTDWCTYPTEAQERVKVGGIFNLNAESILALEPDLIVTGNSENLAETFSFLDGTGIPYLVVDPQNLEEIELSITKIAEVVGSAAKGEAIVAQLQADRAVIAERVAAIAEADRPSVFVMIDTESLFTVGEGEFLADLISSAGGRNIAAGLGSGYFEMSEEKLFELDPEVIIATFPMRERLLARESWQGLQAVKNGRVYDVNGDLVSRPGPRVVLGMEELYRAFFQ
ncbi:MAG: cobalamin-binding protein [Clostridium sp.]|nr:cobalamin-binding protein [Clostridium sp.]